MLTIVCLKTNYIYSRLLTLSPARVYKHTSGIVVLDVKVYLEMPREKSKSKPVPEGNGPVPQDKPGLGGLTMEKTRRMFSKELDNCFDR